MVGRKRMTSKFVKNLALGLAAVAASVLAGCATTETSLGRLSAQWVGKDVAAVTEQWGTTEEKQTLSDGSELWVYHKTNQATIGGQSPTTTTRTERTEVTGINQSRQVPYEETNYDPTTIVHSKCEARFTIKDGVVKSAEFKGYCS
jgi:hypothetical protein